MTEKPTTESDSHYDHLEKMSIHELLIHMNNEDQTVAKAVEKVIPKIEQLVSKIVIRMVNRGRIFYIGAGTSGRLGIVDASECPPTFGVDHNVVIGLIAGGDTAIHKAAEFAEDDEMQGWKDIEAYQPNEEDTVIGIAASGRTPYVIGAVEKARQNNLLTGCITCNEHAKLASVVEHPIEVIVGPEFVSGSTRMKAGTAQKLILNMISTSVMIKMGRVKGNKMVDMQLSNQKLVLRGVQMLVEELGFPPHEAKNILEHHGSVRTALEHYNKK